MNREFLFYFEIIKMFNYVRLKIGDYKEKNV